MCLCRNTFEQQIKVITRLQAKGERALITFSNKINRTIKIFSLYENIKVHYSLFRYSKIDCKKTNKATEKL
jgi:hypothetical protein